MISNDSKDTKRSQRVQKFPNDPKNSQTDGTVQKIQADVKKFQTISKDPKYPKRSFGSFEIN